jgi:hypothetical protein
MFNEKNENDHNRLTCYDPNCPICMEDRETLYNDGPFAEGNIIIGFSSSQEEKQVGKR